MGLNNEVYNRYAKVEIRVIVGQMMYRAEEHVKRLHSHTAILP